jgi:hypothetical protein
MTSLKLAVTDRSPGTLVGIAAEDEPRRSRPYYTDEPGLGPRKAKRNRQLRLNGAHSIATRRAGDPKVAKPVLAPEASGELRDRSLAGINALACGDDAAIWAHRSLGYKNRLTAPDGQRVEEAFQARLATLAASLRTSLRRDQ